MGDRRIVTLALALIVLVGIGIGFWLVLQDEGPPADKPSAADEDSASQATRSERRPEATETDNDPTEAGAEVEESAPTPEESEETTGEAEEPAEDVEPEWKANVKEFTVKGRVSFRSDDRPAGGAEVRAVAGNEPDYYEWEREAKGEPGGPDRPDLQAVGQDTADGVGLFSFTVKATGFATRDELEKNEFAGLFTNSLRVIATLPGYAPARSDRIRVSMIEDEIEVNLTLSRATTLKGRAVDAATGQPVPRAWVSIQDRAAISDREGGRDGRHLITDKEGRFELDDLPAASWSVIVQAVGYASYWSGSNDDVEIVTRPGEALDLGDLPLQPQLSVVGRIVDESGEPVPEVRARLTNRDRNWVDKRESSDETGKFVFADVDPGAYDFLASKHGFAEAEVRDVRVGDTGPVDLGDITLPRGLMVRISVHNRGGDGVPSAYVVFKQGGERSVIDSEKNVKGLYTLKDGTYELQGLYEGDFIIEVRKEGYATHRGVVKVDTDGQAIDVVLDKGGSVTARILDEEGQPEAGVKCVAINQNSRDYLRYRYTPHVSPPPPIPTSDEDGYVEIPDLPSGTFLIVARTSYERRMERDNVVVTQGEATDLGDWRFELPGQVRVTVTRGGQPVPELEVWLAPGEGNFKSYRERVTTDSNGTAVFEDVPVEDWVVRAGTIFERNPRGRTVTVAAGKTAEFHLELQPKDRAHVAGRFTINGEDVIRDVAIAGRGRRAGIFKRTRTDDGTFEFPSLEPGPYVLLARESRQSVPARLEITIDGTGKNEVLHDFQGYRVSGRVSVSGGDAAPLDAVDVRITRIGEEPVSTPRTVMGVAGVEPDGSFAFDRVPEGQYRVAAVLTGHGVASTSIRVVSGDISDLSLTIGEDAGSLRITIRNLQGRRPDGRTESAYVDVKDADGNLVELGERNYLPLAEGGMYRAETIPSGRYTVQISASGFLPVTERGVVVETGETTDVSVDLTAGAELHLTVTNGEVTQEMLDGATVRYFDAGGSELEVASNLFDSFGATTTTETPTLFARHLHDQVAELRVKVDGYLELTIPVQPQPGQKIEKQETLLAE